MKLEVGGEIVVEEELKHQEPLRQSACLLTGTRLMQMKEMWHIVKIEVLDENGNIVPNANEPVQIIVEGEGRLIGLDNGSPVDHTSMKSNNRNTFNGLALAVVQSNNKTERFVCGQIHDR